MKHSKYEVLLKAVEYKSLSKTADYCHYSQSAVSQIIQALECELGITLLSRNHSGVNLTEDGKELLPYIRTLSNSYIELGAQAASIAGVKKGLLRIGTFSSASCHLLAPMLKDFKKFYPGIRVELYQGCCQDIENWIKEGTVDFGFVDLPTFREFKVFPIIQDEMLALLPARHPYVKATTVPLKLFAQEPVIFLDEGNKKEVRDMFRKHHVQPRIEYVSADQHTVMSMVEHGLGISMLSSLVMRKTKYDIVAKRTEPNFHRKIGVAVKNARHTSIAVSRFLECLENHFGKDLSMACLQQQRA
jgi:DNA-binding transcriptional LysR family regulator